MRVPVKNPIPTLSGLGFSHKMLNKECRMQNEALKIDPLDKLYFSAFPSRL